ncbi:MAG: hypothetical protein AAFY38_13175 [Pseudomonadota bacterium]
MKRFIQGLLTGVALSSLLLLTGIPGVLPNVIDRLDRAAMAEWRLARLRFLTDVAFLSCASPNDLRAAAEVRGWGVEVEVPREEGVTALLRIHTRPEQPFDKDPGDLARFDERGCLMR